MATVGVRGRQCKRRESGRCTLKPSVTVLLNSFVVFSVTSSFTGVVSARVGEGPGSHTGSRRDQDLRVGFWVGLEDATLMLGRTGRGKG